MHCTDSFYQLLRDISKHMTAPTQRRWVKMMEEWIAASSGRISDVLVATDIAGNEHHGAYYDVFYKNAWALDDMGLELLGIVLSTFGHGNVQLVVDDTLAQKSSSNIYGVGWFRDAVNSSKSKITTSIGHNWVVMGALVTLATGQTACLPIMFRLHMSEKMAKKHHQPHSSQAEHAANMLEVIHQKYPDTRFKVVGDGAYGGQAMLDGLSSTGYILTARIKNNARVYDQVLPHTKGKRGRPSKHGTCIKSPAEMVTNSKGKILDLRSEGVNSQLYKVVSYIGHLHTHPKLPVRIVVAQRLSKPSDIQAFYSSDIELSAEQILEIYDRRWAIEVSNRESKQHLGFCESQSWTAKSVERTAPMAMLMYSVVMLWFEQEGHAYETPIHRDWYRHRQHASFADKLRTLNEQIGLKAIKRISAPQDDIHKIQNMLLLAIRRAG